MQKNEKTVDCKTMHVNAVVSRRHEVLDLKYFNKKTVASGRQKSQREPSG